MKLTIATKGLNDIIDITPDVTGYVRRLKTKEGICLIFCPGSTCGITTIEYESGLIEDFKRVLEKIAPMSEDYEHCKKWVETPGASSKTNAPSADCNGYAHIRSALIKPFLTVPIENGELVLGTWQQIILIDFDNRPRTREVIIKVIGE